VIRAITVVPGVPGSARLAELPEPAGHGSVLVQGLALGVCGTDAEIVGGDYGWSPPGRDRLVLGHESLGRVLEAPEDSQLTAGDLLVGIVRRPDPVPCRCCAAGEWDMCRNGRYTERGIKELDGYGAERWRVEPEFAVRLDPALEEVGVLMEPTSIVAKAWDHIERIASRACSSVETVLVTGAGPIGMLAALLAKQRSLDVHVLDLVEGGAKPEAVEALGGTYHCKELPQDLAPDVTLECTGAGALVLDVMQRSAVGGIVCLTGVSSGGHALSIDAGSLNREIVLENDVVFGSVNANRHHYDLAADALAAADRGWLRSLITRRGALADWGSALARERDDIKVVIDLDR
jgi:threonine dehydrogenase-like Zn-dependent dehydrogenase